MDYNPHAQRHANLLSQLQTARGERDRLRTTWDRLTERTYSEVLAEQMELRERQLNLADNAARMNAGLEEMDGDIKKIRDELGSGWNPLNWFKKEPPGLRDKLEFLKQNRGTLYSQSHKTNEELGRIKSRLVHVDTLADELKGFDRERHAALIASTAARIDALMPEFQAVKSVYDMAADQLRGPVSELHSKEQELARVERDLARANELDRRLSQAADGRARGPIHGECEREFGEGSPKRVIIEKGRRLAELQRDVNKARVHVNEIVLRTGRDVRTVVIDGSNMCYIGKQFIGLAALVPAVNALQQRFSVVVGFDSGICRQLGVSEQALRTTFGPRVVVHVTQGKADETLLNAAEEPTAFVVSRDRYGDFGHKDAVRKRRILGHEIVNGRVMINDLGVNVELLPAN